MKIRTFTVAAGLVCLLGLVLMVASVTRVPWLITTALCFSGILLFDAENAIVKTWLNAVLFLGVYGLVLQGLTEPSSESFWRDFAGAALLISFLFEQNSLPWSGGGFLRSTILPATLFFILVLAQNIPFLRAGATLAFGFAGVLVFSFLELFSIRRENNDMSTGTFMSALRAATCGLASLFYASVFLPGAAKEAPFVYSLVVLPMVGLVVAVISLFLRHWRRRYILFCCNWSVLVFWAALTGETNRVYAAIAALVAQVWTIMMTAKHAVDPRDTRDLYLKLSGWGIPGSLLFSMIIFILIPSDNFLVQEGTAVWLLTFFVYWSGLRRFEFPKKPTAPIVWGWRSRLALAVTVLGAGLLAGLRVFPQVMNNIWGMAR